MTFEKLILQEVKELRPFSAYHCMRFAGKTDFLMVLWYVYVCVEISYHAPCLNPIKIYVFIH